MHVPHQPGRKSEVPNFKFAYLATKRDPTNEARSFARS
jgi:hypothetical protein